MFCFVAVLSFVACRPDASSTTSKGGNVSGASSFDWLLGDWIRTNGDIGTITYEHWTKLSSELYQGHGYTIVGLDTVSGESIRLLQEGAKWRLEVTAKDEESPTIFPMLESTKGSFTCTHPTLEFPNKIWYRRDAELLKATVSGDDIELEFVFEEVIDPQN